MKMEWNNRPFLLYDIAIFYRTPQYSTSGWTLVAAPSRACGQSRAFSCLGVAKLIRLVELCNSLSYFLLFVAVKWCWCEVVQTLMRTLIFRPFIFFCFKRFYLINTLREIFYRCLVVHLNAIILYSRGFLQVFLQYTSDIRLSLFWVRRTYVIIGRYLLNKMKIVL